MRNKSLTVFMKLFVIVMLVILVGVSVENKLMNRNSGLDVAKEYEATSSNEVTSPLIEMDINNKIVKIAVVGKAQISADKNNKSNELLNPKHRYQFIGDYKFNDYIINFNDENPLISTELQLDGKWCIYASAIAETTTLIDGTHYFLGVTVMHDKDYNIESLSFNIFDTDKSMVGQYTFENVTKTKSAVGVEIATENAGTTETESKTESKTETETKTETKTETDAKNESHYLTLKDITDCPFYRPELTIEMAKSEGLELIEAVSGTVYGNEWVEYTFYDWAPTPIAMTIKSNSEACSIMGIRIDDTFETALSLLPQDYDWKSNFNNLIYGSLSDGVTPGDYFHGSAHILENGIGTITLVPKETYPFVQYIISNNKVEKINVLYYSL